MAGAGRLSVAARVRVLVVNAGSSSLKHALVDARGASACSRAGRSAGSPSDARRPPRRGAARGARRGGRRAREAVGHRVVHGGARFSGPVLIDDGVRAAIAALAPLAPLHTRAALEGIDAAAAALPGLPQVACFDTAFHRTLPAEAATYALPREWSERFGLRRFGFHGLNVAWCPEQARADRSARDGCRRLVVCHLGSGCSVSAVLDGRSVDTTMGFTPLEGVPMATRSGSVDPGLLLHLLASRHRARRARRRAQPSLRPARHLPACRACARSSARRPRGDARAQLAFDVLVRGVSGAVAAMTTSLRGLDALVFTAGAGERSALLRADGLRAPRPARRRARRRRATRPRASASRAGGAAVAVLVVAAGEEIVIARQTRGRARRSPGRVTLGAQAQRQALRGGRRGSSSAVTIARRASCS